MKKIFMTMMVAMVAMVASAQVYVGGNFGIASVSVDGADDDETIYSLLPEIGYKFSDEIAVGAEFGWSKAGLSHYNGELTITNLNRTFEINPYLRYTFFQSKVVNAFVDASVGYCHYNGAEDVYSVGLKPGVEVKLNKFSLISRLGFLGYAKDKNYDSEVWGMDFGGQDLTFGLLYNF